MIFSILCLLILPFSSHGQQETNSYDLEGFIDDLKQAIEKKDLESFKRSFASDLKEIEEARFKNFIYDFSMDSISVENISISQKDSYRSEVYLTLIFQNLYSVIFDTWRLELAKANGAWKILNKISIGQTQTLYKLKIPSEKIERVKKIEVNHKDISFTFEDSVLFYDNIPDLDTGLIVIGKGQVEFTPSLSRERHHLELMYRDPSINARIEYLYLRFSPDYFDKNVKIIKGGVEERPILESERQMAQELFEKNYPRSFTVRSSLTNDFFSVLPKEEEVAFDFKTKKIGELTYIFSPFAFEEINLHQWKKDKVICLYSPPVEEEGKKMFISFGQKFDVQDYQLAVTYDPEQNHFSGQAKIKFESNVGRLSSLKFIINPKLRILRINDQEQNKLYFSQDDYRRTVYVYLLDSLSSGESGEIEIFYRGKLPPLEESHEAAEAIQRNTKIEFVETRDKTYFYSRSSYWYPAPSEEDYFTARLELVLPPGYSAVSNGHGVKEISEENTGVRKEGGKDSHSLNTFEVRKKVKYLAFVVGKWIKEEEVKVPIPIDYYRAPNTQAYTENVIQNSIQIIEFYQSRFGSYPFDKLSVVKHVGKRKGGYSPAGFVVIKDLPLMSGVSSRRMTRSPVDLSSYHEYFLAHEIAHQWWGQGVSWDSYHDQWISEGLAQFSTILFLKEKYGKDHFSDILKNFSKWAKKNTEWGPIIMGSRISHLDYQGYQSVIYNKASLVLNMLKDWLGEEVFFRGMQRLFLENQYSSLDTKAFISVFDEIAESDLDPFFEMWFYNYHLPEVKVIHSLERNSSGFILRLSVTQDEPVFMFPLWLEWIESGKRVRKKILVDRKVINVQFSLEEKPKKLKVNPDNAVPGQFRLK